MNKLKVFMVILFSLGLLNTSFSKELKIIAEFYGAKLGTVVDAIAKLSHKNIMWSSEALKEKNKKVFVSIQKPVPISKFLKNLLLDYNLILVKKDRIYQIKLAKDHLFIIPIDVVSYLGKDVYTSLLLLIKENSSRSAIIKPYPDTYAIYVKDTAENIEKLKKLVKAYLEPLVKQAEEIKKEEVAKRKKLEEVAQLNKKLIKKEIKISQDEFREIEDELISSLSTYGKYKYDKKHHKLIIWEIKDNYPKLAQILAKLQKIQVKTKCFYVRALEPAEILLNIKENYLSRYGSVVFKSKKIQTVAGANSPKEKNLSGSVITSLPKVCITDSPDRIKKIKEAFSGLLIDRPYQVVIEARIVEINRNFSRDLGIRWGVNKFGNFSSSYQYTIGSGFGNNYIFDFPAASVAAGSGMAIGFSLIGLTGRLDLSLSALESIGKSKVLSRPKIITLDGEPAEISQGFEIPYQSYSANYGTNVEFKEAVLKLSVVPRTLPDGNIVMNITLSQDVPDFGRAVNGQPPINTKKITSKVVAKDGTTIVIGGILEKKSSTAIKGVPVLHRIPLLGWLFKNKLTTKENRELMIFITPKIVYE